MEPDWSEVVRRCLSGDSPAWTELVRAHHRRVYALCYRFTNSGSDAEDLTQDVFLKIYANLKSFDTERGSLQVPVVVVSRIPETSEWLDAIDAGATDYCAAPFEPQHISWLVQSALLAGQRMATGAVR